MPILPHRMQTNRTKCRSNPLKIPRIQKRSTDVTRTGGSEGCAHRWQESCHMRRGGLWGLRASREVPPRFQVTPEILQILRWSEDWTFISSADGCHEKYSEREFGESNRLIPDGCLFAGCPGRAFFYSEFSWPAKRRRRRRCLPQGAAAEPWSTPRSTECGSSSLLPD